MEPYGPPSPAAERLAAVLRTLSAAVLAPDLNDDRRTALAEALTPIAADLHAPASRYTVTETAEFQTSNSATVDPRGTHPFYGTANPAGQPMRFGADEEHVFVHARFDVRHEGAPGWVHGGVIATGFDIALGRAASTFGSRGPTGTMEIRYTASTPLGVDVTFRGWLGEIRGRKTLVHADLHRDDSGEKCAQAHAVFLRPRESVRLPSA